MVFYTQAILPARAVVWVTGVVIAVTAAVVISALAVSVWVVGVTVVSVVAVVVAWIVVPRSTVTVLTVLIGVPVAVARVTTSTVALTGGVLRIDWAVCYCSDRYSKEDS